MTISSTTQSFTSPFAPSPCRHVHRTFFKLLLFQSSSPLREWAQHAAGVLWVEHRFTSICEIRTRLVSLIVVIHAVEAHYVISAFLIDFDLFQFQILVAYPCIHIQIQQELLTWHRIGRISIKYSRKLDSIRQY